MYKQYQFKKPYFKEIIPLLDKDFDEKQSDGILSFSPFHGHRHDEDDHIMSFYDSAANGPDSEKTEKYKKAVRLR